jgi:fermentation-respiration switch protein FrsA (DUF1100 family)
VAILIWLGAAGMLAGAIRFGIRRAIYQPSVYPCGWWYTQAESGARDLWLRASDGTRLHAWWVDVPASRMVTLYLHGNGGNLAHRPGHLREIAVAGSSVLIIDYRGFGKSAGSPSERGLYRDADAGYDYLILLGYRPEQMVVLGESLGAAVAVDLVARRPCSGLILECPFTSLSAMAGHLVPLLGPLFVRGFDSLGKIGQVRVPLLIIHGDRDRTVPYRMGRALFEAAREPKWFWTVEGASHLDIVQVAGLRYRARLGAFYEQAGLRHGIRRQSE